MADGSKSSYTGGGRQQHAPVRRVAGAVTSALSVEAAVVAGLKWGASRSPQDAGRSSLVISLKACAPGWEMAGPARVRSLERVEAGHGGHAAEAPGWEMAGPSPSQVRGEGGGLAWRARSRGSWMGDGRAQPESGPWRGWRPGTEGTEGTQQRLLDGRWQGPARVRSVERVEAGHGGHAAEAPGWEMAGPSPSGPWRGWRLGTEGTQQRLLDGRWQGPAQVRSLERVEARNGRHAAEAPGWEMAGPSPSQVRGEGGGLAWRARSRGSWMGDGRAQPESGPWRGWRPGTEGTQQRLLDGRWQGLARVRSVERVEAGHRGHAAEQGS
ncbi:uncharacterized protein LOC122455002 [Cervus canadensis]|uniref:uncharacterized protein LOC122455002 n=1 Tax=Cervus canadensis TaxID=1574408 RepID=UPI001C9E2934|nr:uncharacterized protein LOC122455002 [Cervus canadensis]